MTDKILTSEELFERLRTIIPNIDEWSDGNTFEDSLAVYNVNDFEDVMNKNNLMEDMLRRICASHRNGTIDNLMVHPKTCAVKYYTMTINHILDIVFNTSVGHKSK